MPHKTDSIRSALLASSIYLQVQAGCLLNMASAVSSWKQRGIPLDINTPCSTFTLIMCKFCFHAFSLNYSRVIVFMLQVLSTACHVHTCLCDKLNRRHSFEGLTTKATNSHTRNLKFLSLCYVVSFQHSFGFSSLLLLTQAGTTLCMCWQVLLLR